MTVKIYILKAYSYFLAGFDWHFSPWIRIQKAQMLRNQQIQILNTAEKYMY